MAIPSEFSYVSATTSPTPSICSLEDSTMNFYSAPTSPISEFSNALFGLSQTEPSTPTSSYEDCSNFNLDDFEFDTSLRFNQYDDVESKQEPENPVDHEQQRGDSLPAMSFADELFCNGKVVPLAPPQLKLPPRLCGGNDKSGCRSGGAAAPLSSPRTPRSVLRLPFARQCLWNDEFDPFMVAIENVREEKRGKNHRRARSLSPLRARPNESVGVDEAQRPMLESGLDSNGPKQPNRSSSLRWESPKEAAKGEAKGPMQEMGLKSNEERQLNGSASPKQEGKSPKGLAEPKGVVIARQVRRAKMDPEEKPSESDTTPAQQPTMETGNTPSGESREIKRQKIMRFLFKGPTSKKVSAEENKVKDQNAASSKSTFLSRWSFKSMNKTLYSEEKTVVSQVAKMTLVQYKPRLSLCMGYGSKSVQ